jgi:hypothetical protein
MCINNRREPHPKAHWLNIAQSKKTPAFTTPLRRRFVWRILRSVQLRLIRNPSVPLLPWTVFQSVFSWYSPWFGRILHRQHTHIQIDTNNVAHISSVVKMFMFPVMIWSGSSLANTHTQTCSITLTCTLNTLCAAPIMSIDYGHLEYVLLRLVVGWVALISWRTSCSNMSLWISIVIRFTCASPITLWHVMNGEVDKPWNWSNTQCIIALWTPMMAVLMCAWMHMQLNFPPINPLRWLTLPQRLVMDGYLP